MLCDEHLFTEVLYKTEIFQSKLSQQIRGLVVDLGIPLFDFLEQYALGVVQ